MRGVALGLLLLLSGCLASGTDLASVSNDVRADALDVLVLEHDHQDAAAHVGAKNLELVAYHNGFDDSGAPDNIPAGGWFTELAVTEAHVYLARQSDDGLFGGFGIIDITNASNPRMLGSFPALGGSDIEVSHDESLAFFSTQRNSVEQMVASGQQEGPSVPRGITIVDIRNKSAPAMVGFQPLPVNGPHTLTYFLHSNGQELLVACTYDLVTDPGTGAIVSAVPATQRVLIFEVDREAMMTRLVSQYQVAASAPAGKLYFPHDAIPQRHPDGRTLMTVAYWDQGVHLVDLTNPANPTLVAKHTDFAPSSRNNIHQAKAFEETIDGFHVTVTEPEIISADETGWFHFLDTTRPEAPKKLGHWTLPGDLLVRNLDFSPHNFDTWDGKLALAHNHAGVWVVDVGSEEDLRDPKTVAYYMPALHREDSPRPSPYPWGLFAQEVKGETLLFVSDEGSGLHILRYTGP